MFIPNQYPYLAPEGGEGGSGGAGGKADGGDGKAGSAGLSEEDVGRVVNAAVTSHLKRTLGPAISEAFGGLKLDDKIAETIAKLIPKPAEKAADDAGKKTTDIEKQYAELAAKLEATEKRANESERARIDTEQRSKFDSAYTKFRNLVQPKVKQEFVDVIVPHWARTEGRLKVLDDGSATLRVKRAPYKGAPEVDEDVPLDEAVPVLLASSEAKAFLPAPGSGSGGDNGNGGNRGRQSRQSTAGTSSDKTDPMSKSLEQLDKLGVSIDDLLT